MRKNNMEYFERLFMTGELDGNTDDDGKGDGDTSDAYKKLEAENKTLREEKDAILKNKNEILAEKKQRDQEKRDAAEEALKANAEKAENDKNFAEFKKSHDEIMAKKDNELKTERATFSKAQEDAEATRIASRIAEGDNVELISAFIRPRLRFEGGSLQVLSATGELTAQSIAELENEFTNSAKYASLLKGRQSSGGGAGGGSGGAGGKTETMPRSEFDAMEQSERSAFSIAGGKVTPD